MRVGDEKGASGSAGKHSSKAANSCGLYSRLRSTFLMWSRTAPVKSVAEVNLQRRELLVMDKGQWSHF